MYKPKTVVKQFKKSDWLNRKWSDWRMAKKGYAVVGEEIIRERSLLKTGVLAIIFLPLALAGKSDHVKVTYELIEQ